MSEKKVIEFELKRRNLKRKKNSDSEVGSEIGEENSIPSKTITRIHSIEKIVNGENVQKPLFPQQI